MEKKITKTLVFWNVSPPHFSVTCIAEKLKNEQAPGGQKSAPKLSSTEVPGLRLHLFLIPNKKLLLLDRVS